MVWSSSDEGVATVDSAGLVTPVYRGVALITAGHGDVAGSARVVVTADPDREALVALYDATYGDTWGNNTNWLSDRPLGDWHGVRTDRQGRVVALWLPGNALSGAIPPDLGGLANLRRLSLSGNRLSGAIPPELGRNISIMLSYNVLS